MAGRRPKPSALKALAGNPGKRAINRNEPKPDGVPDCPRHLDKEAKREWRRVSVELVTLGLLTSVNRAALAAYCAAYSRWASAKLNVQKFGVVIKSPKSGFPIQNPYVGVANTPLDQMRKFAVEFGLTPASRSRLQVDTNKPPTDPFEAFMTGIGAMGDSAAEDNATDDDPSRAIH